MERYEEGMTRRAERMLGTDVMGAIRKAKVIVFGVGGVGSWCVEALVRSGIRNITIVDSDRVCTTNINRQLLATQRTVGCEKVVAMKERILEINPYAEVTTYSVPFNSETAEQFHIESYDYVIDAIDSLKDKILLIRMATDADVTFFSSMGAALKMDPTQIHVAEFWKVRGCPLGAMLRKRIKQSRNGLKKKFLCVYSEELLENRGDNMLCGTEQCICRGKCQPNDGMTIDSTSTDRKKAQVNGSMAHITGIFGFTLAGLVLEDIRCKSLSDGIDGVQQTM